MPGFGILRGVSMSIKGIETGPGMNMTIGALLGQAG